MTALLKTCAASLMLAAAFAASAASDDTPVGTPVEAQIAVRDAATGKLRLPTATELKALRDAGSLKQLAPRTIQRKAHASGATGVRVNDGFVSYSVMVKQADGKLAEFCFDDLQAAQAALDAGLPTAPEALPTK